MAAMKYHLPIILLISFFFFLFIPLVIKAQNSNHFAEYIGAEFNGVKFSDVPINPNVDFHFILAFALDYTTTTSPPSSTNGNFNVFWDADGLSADQIKRVKQNHPNVKVAVSLGGNTIAGDKAFFNPSSTDSWVTNAASSLTSIIREYHLDGIDVNYENFQAESTTFSDCIGRLITTLKRNNVISFASIAPYAKSSVQEHYRALWRNYGDAIDYVNFQFYAYDSGTTVAQLLSYYEDQRSNYNGGKVLVGCTGDGSRGISPANAFFDACQSLKKEGKLVGIFVWEADTSKSTGFMYEKYAQYYLAQ